MKQERDGGRGREALKKSFETVLAVKGEKEEAVKVEKDVRAGPDYKGLYSSQAFLSSLPSKTDSVSQMDD